ncbi:MAG: sigma-70 family RNA polymerase sigma factor [bacterium]|nr:sigma-70 family RNA polymerase sigma factor [bacterium]
MRIVQLELNMDAAGTDTLMDWGSAWPTICDWIDSDPDLAARSIIDTGYRYLMASPPRAFRYFPRDRYHDLAADIMLFMVRDDFAVIRRYRDRGRSFLGWFRTAANNRAIDIYRHERPNLMVVLEPDLDSPTSDSEYSDVAERVREAIDSLRNPLCTTLLVWRLVHEYTNKEIAVALGWSASRNAEVGNIYRNCRLGLIRRLAAMGIGPSALIN